MITLKPNFLFSDEYACLLYQIDYNSGEPEYYLDESSKGYGYPRIREGKGMLNYAKENNIKIYRKVPIGNIKKLYYGKKIFDSKDYVFAVHGRKCDYEYNDFFAREKKLRNFAEGDYFLSHNNAWVHVDFPIRDTYKVRILHRLRCDKIKKIILEKEAYLNEI